MKKLTLAVMIALTSIFCSAQDSTWVFSRMVELPGVNQDLILDVANEYFTSQHMTNNKDFLIERTMGKMTGVSKFTVYTKGFYGTSGSIIYMYKFLAKDGKCKLEVWNFSHISTASGGKITNEKADCGTFSMSKKAWADIKEQTKGGARIILNGFEKRMMKLMQKPEDF